MHTDPLEERINFLLETYSIEELLELSDTTVFEAVYRLVEIGALTLPEVEPL
jgi:hypothetical protein